MKGFVSRFLIYFLAGLLILQLFAQPETITTEERGELPPITISTQKADYDVYGNVAIVLQNNRDRQFRLAYQCPELPFKLETAVVAEPTPIDYSQDLVSCEEEETVVEIDPFRSQTIVLSEWSAALFADQGRFRFSFDYAVEEGSFNVVTSDLEITDRGFFSSIWYRMFYQPTYNLLIGLIWILPFNNLGLGIIVLTLLVRLILLIPSQKALRAQRDMQKIQPKIEELRKKYKDNQQKLAEETMKIWKEHKVNPLGSCLPILIQFPLLLALFQVTREGISVGTSYVLYPFLEGFDYLTLVTEFLGYWDLTQNDLIILPLTIGILQFIQLKLTFAKAPAPKKIEGMPSMNPQKYMQYILPPLIVLFAASVPAGVSLYWGTSTLFAIGQQLVINKETASEEQIIDAEVVEKK